VYTWQEVLEPRYRRVVNLSRLDRVDLLEVFGQTVWLAGLGLVVEGDRTLDQRIENKCVDVVILVFARDLVDSEMLGERNRDGLGPLLSMVAMGIQL
jgi:hypothetical protein